MTAYDKLGLRLCNDEFGDIISGKVGECIGQRRISIKLEEINKLVQLKDYKGAMSIVDSIDWRRVKNVRLTLCVVGEIYAANKRYEDSKEIFLLAYNRASQSEKIFCTV